MQHKEVRRIRVEGATQKPESKRIPVQLRATTRANTWEECVRLLTQGK